MLETKSGTGLEILESGFLDNDENKCILGEQDFLWLSIHLVHHKQNKYRIYFPILNSIIMDDRWID